VKAKRITQNCEKTRKQRRRDEQQMFITSNRVLYQAHHGNKQLKFQNKTSDHDADLVNFLKN
jgi:hypothetical protein